MSKKISKSKLRYVIKFFFEKLIIFVFLWFWAYLRCHSKSFFEEPKKRRLIFECLAKGIFFSLFSPSNIHTRQHDDWKFNMKVSYMAKRLEEKMFNNLKTGINIDSAIILFATSGGMSIRCWIFNAIWRIFPKILNINSRWWKKVAQTFSAIFKYSTIFQ